MPALSITGASGDGPIFVDRRAPKTSSAIEIYGRRMWCRRLPIRMSTLGQKWTSKDRVRWPDLHIRIVCRIHRSQNSAAKPFSGFELRIGAGDGNRTHVCSLGSCRSTIELHPHAGRAISMRCGGVQIDGDGGWNNSTLPPFFPR